MIGTIVLLALLFGGIAIWAGIRMMKAGNKTTPRPRVIAPSPTDARGSMIVRQRERESLRPGQRAF
jgi:hypothetical protein